MCLQKKFKDNDKPAHLVGHSKLRSLDIYVFLKITSGVDENQASVTGNTKEYENVAGETNDYADVNI